MKGSGKAQVKRNGAKVDFCEKATKKNLFATISDSNQDSS